MNKLYGRQTGFTLIELVIVIVILGILAVTAAPRFLDLGGDARASIINGAAGAVASARDLVHAKALIEGKQNLAASSVSIDGATTVDISYGYPTASGTGMLLALELQFGAGEQFLVTGYPTSGTRPAVGIIYTSDSDRPSVNVVPGNGTGGEANDGCYVAYTQAADANTRPVITVNTDNC